EHDGIATGAIQLEHNRRHVEAQVDGIANAQEFFRMALLHHTQETTQTLRVVVIPSIEHANSLWFDGADDSTFASEHKPTFSAAAGQNMRSHPRGTGDNRGMRLEVFAADDGLARA